MPRVSVAALKPLLVSCCVRNKLPKTSANMKAYYHTQLGLHDCAQQKTLEFDGDE